MNSKRITRKANELLSLLGLGESLITEDLFNSTSTIFESENIKIDVFTKHDEDYLKLYNKTKRYITVYDFKSNNVIGIKNDLARFFAIF